MKRALSLLVIYYLLANSSLAQINIDSLRQTLPTQKNDSNKVKTYLHFFYTDLYYSNPDEVIQLTKKAIELSKKIEFKKGEADAYNTLGYMHRIRSENDSALFYFKKGTVASEEIQYISGIADAYTGLGNTYNQLGDWQKAIPHFQNVIKTAEAAGNNVLVASANNNIGNIYLSKGAYIKALEHYQKGVELGNPSIKETSLINIGLVHQHLEDFPRARKYLEEAVAMCEESGNKYSLAFIYQHLGTLEQKSNNFQLAIDYYNEATQIFRDINERYNVSDIKTNLANLFYKRGNYQNALLEFRESIAIQMPIGHYVGICNNMLGVGKVLLAKKRYDAAEDTLLIANLMADTLELLPVKCAIAQTLSTLYKDREELSKALVYYEAYKALNDSLTNLEKSELVAEMETKFEVSQKEQEIELLSAENQVANLQLQQHQNLRNYLLILTIVLILLVAVGYNRYQFKVKANQKLKELDYIKTNFFTNISHEFRTPLTLILNPIDKILRNQKEVLYEDDLKLVQRNADRLLELTNQLLDLSKLEAGKLKLSVAENNLTNFLQINVAAFESLAKSKNINFLINISDNLQSAYFDQDNLQKILNNLLSNAFKFTPESGTVNFTAFPKNDFVEIRVKDTGPGIAAEQRDKIFERFHQIQENKTNIGSGIGLTLIRELVFLNHGSIQVESILGEGSTFILNIPIKASTYKKDEFIPAIEKLTTSNIQLNSLKKEDDPLDQKVDSAIALVVEDNIDLINHITSLLSSNYKVIQATNGEEGLKKAIKFIPDIVISDWMMPKMDGLELCKKLKTDDRTNHIPIIMLTAKADMVSKLDGLKIGADDYLSKPFNTDELLVRVNNLINQRDHLRDKYHDKITIAPSKKHITDLDQIFITKALAVVDQHISDTAFTVEKLQKEIGMSRMQLHRKLKALTNLSSSEFIRNLRLQRSADLLKVNGISVSDVAYQSGFNSLSYFTQCFKEKYGITPSQYNKQID